MSEALVERLNAAEIALRDDRPYAAVAIGEAADRIETLARENAALRDDDAKMQLLHQQEYQLIAAERKVAELEAEREAWAKNALGNDDCRQMWQSRAEAAEADKARLSEELRPFAAVADKYSDAEDDDFQVWLDFDVLGAMLTLRHFRAARAALSGSGSVWRLVPYLWQCKDYADGWLSFANEDEAQAYQRDTGCAVRITYRPLPAAPQQRGE